MIHEESVYDMQVGKAAQLVEAYANEGLAILERILGRLVAFWSVDTGGNIDQLIQVWEFESDDDRRVRREALWKDPEWVDFAARYGYLITRRSMRILLPVSFSV
ncbi:MAG: NIPSNAP family protein [Actinomycetota bacterium]|nr:NIPSNAP family protein [Actinomycetota bacterium]